MHALFCTTCRPHVECALMSNYQATGLVTPEFTMSRDLIGWALSQVYLHTSVMLITVHL